MDVKDNVEKIRTKAVNYIGIKPRTRKQVIRYLKEKGFGEEEISEVVRELEEYRYIDDMEYCRLYFQYGFEKKRGVGRIKRELAEKGVDSEIIQIALEDMKEDDAIPDPFETALSIGKSMTEGLKVDLMSWDEKRRLQAKIGRRLMSRGFSQDVAYQVINHIAK